MLLMRKMLAPTAISGRAGNSRKDRADEEMNRKKIRWKI